MTSTHTFESLAKSDFATLDALLAEGRAPSFVDIAGWEFRGWNVLNAIAKPVAAVMPMQRFAKGFFVRPGVDVASAPYLEGYNIKIARGGLGEDWTHHGGGGPERAYYYRVFGPNQGERREGKYPNALFLDYSLGDPSNTLFTGRGIRDFIVAVTPDLLVGKAFFTLGPLTVVGGIFIGARWRKADFAPPAARAA